MSQLRTKSRTAPPETPSDTPADQAAGAGETGPSAPSFESAAERLAAIVAQMERGELPLDQALALFEEGMALARSAQTRLDEAERRLEELIAEDAEGRPATRPFEG
ncbi:MAG: exodeoxyribonuclease VII small subunit [Polyangiaceae bacterium]|nr:exodeoxyribonuclease VII small subunit [Polyangiaceae bacterium]